MGKPGGGNTLSSNAEYIGMWKRTRGTETSHYPQEEKETSISLVVVSERGTAQTDLTSVGSGLWDRNVGLTSASKTVWEVRP